MKDYKFYTNKYLAEKELTENDLYYLFDTPSLNYSLVVNMFKFMKHKMRAQEIIDLCKTDERWVYKYHWTKEDRNKYRDILIKIFKNIYGYRDYETESAVDWWLFQYAFSVEGENLLDE